MRSVDLTATRPHIFTGLWNFHTGMLPLPSAARGHWPMPDLVASNASLATLRFARECRCPRHPRVADLLLQGNQQLLSGSSRIVGAGMRLPVLFSESVSHPAIIVTRSAPYALSVLTLLVRRFNLKPENPPASRISTA